jgi:osmotically-inducible protein OsmY
MSRIVEYNGTVYLAGIVSDDKELEIKWSRF